MTGGKLTRQGSARRASLLDAAEAVLVAKGNADASLRAVAAEAGVRLGHLQHYFPTRADLVRAVLERALDRSLERLTGPAGLGGPDGPGPDPAEAVAVVLAEQEDPHLVRLFVEIWALAARDEAIAEAVRAFYRRYADHVTAYVRTLRPDWPAERCRGRAETFVALAEGASLLRSGIAGHRSAATDAHLVEAAIRLLRD
ncbi:TetR/AcrR family transcriptional regulator [Streptomyces sp. URMC 126]|uniref:TetR/AcrR family transcriptional regulator n=1 Tax=Streptomyces sp. URMC 126 TaxID=3423401 RepID=UPI003F1B6080